jgi:hypothetical protein
MINSRKAKKNKSSKEMYTFVKIKK